MQSVTEMFCKSNESSNFKVITPKRKHNYTLRKKSIEQRRDLKDVKFPSVGRIELNQYLIDNEMTDIKFGDKIGIGRKEINKWASGKTKPKEKWIKILSDVCKIHPEKWEDEFEKNEIMNLGLRFLKLYMKENCHGYTSFGEYVGCSYETVKNWFKNNKIGSVWKDVILIKTQIPIHQFHIEISDKEWEEIIKNENNIPWKKNNKTKLRKKEKPKINNEIDIMNIEGEKHVAKIRIDDIIVLKRYEEKIWTVFENNIEIGKIGDFISETLKNNIKKEQFKEFIYELLEKNKDKNWINDFLWTEKRNDINTCEACDIKRIIGYNCYLYMEKLTGIDCADENIIFKVIDRFEQCDKNNTNYEDTVFDENNNEFMVIGFVTAEDTKFENYIVLKNTKTNEEIIDDISNYKMKV